jgi:hypothetical protein
MRLTGRSVTVLLSTLLIVTLTAGAAAAWALGRQRVDSSITTSTGAVDYSAGPSSDQSVRLTADAGHHPRAQEISGVLQGYFDSINNRDYDSWVRAVAASQSSVQDPQRWAREYSTSVDSNFMVTAVSDDPLRARMLFTSEQSVDLAPPTLPADCIEWDVTYLLSDTDHGLVLSGIDPSAQSMMACG